MGTNFEFLSKTYEFTSPSNGYGDITSPTFGGITSVTPEDDGSFLIQFPVGSTTKNPLRYEIYVLPGTVTGAVLFSDDANVTKIVQGHTMEIFGNPKYARIFTLADQLTYFVKDSSYTFGVVAIDAFGIEGGPGSVITSTAIASGNFPVVMQSFLDQMSTNNTTMNGYLTTFNTYLGNLNTYVNTNLSNLITTLSGYLTTFNSYLSSMNTYNNTYNSLNTQFDNDLGQFETDIDQLEMAISSLNTVSSSLASEGGLEMTITTDQMEIDISEDTEV